MTTHPRARATNIWVWILAALSGLAGLIGVLMSLRYAGLPSAISCGPVCQHQQLVKDLTSAPSNSLRLAPEERRLAFDELASNPVQADAWLSLAVMDAEHHGGRLTANARAALERSYEFAPVDVRTAPARLKFAFNHWDQLAPQDRKAALTELTVLDGAPQKPSPVEGFGMGDPEPVRPGSLYLS